MKTTLFFLLPAILATLAAADDWPMPFHDPALTGRSGLKGAMTTAPEVSWSFPLAPYRGYLRIAPGAVSTATVDAEENPDYLTRTAESWGLAPRRFVYDNGSVLDMRDSDAVRWADWLPNEKFPQRVSWHGKGLDGRVRLEVFRNGPGRPETVWETAVTYNGFHRPQVLAADVNADGRLEAVTGSYYYLTVHDGQTGKLLADIHYPHRSRGFLGAINMDDEPGLEIVNIGNFQLAIESLDFVAGKIKTNWRRNIELDISRHRCAVQCPLTTLSDIDRDGRIEILFNLCNDTGDGDWHVVAYDALTGEPEVDLPATYVLDATDLDGDGLLEIVCQKTTGLCMFGYMPLAIYNLREGQAVSRWSTECGFIPRIPLHRQPPQLATFKTGGGARQIAWGDFGGDDRRGFVYATRKPTGRPSQFVETWHGLDAQDEGWKDVWTVEALPGIRLTVEAVSDVNQDGKDEALLSWISPTVASTEFKGRGADVQVKSFARNVAGKWPVVAPDLRGNGRPIVVATAPGDFVVAVEPPQNANKKPRLLWRVAGRGEGPEDGVLAADLDGDGTKEVVLARPDDQGRASVVALRHDGSVLWSRSFRRFHGRREVYRLGGLRHLFVARLTDPKRYDVVVNIMRTVMHSDESYALSGPTGDILWHHDSAAVWNEQGKPTREAWGYGGFEMAFFDLTGDGHDEVFFEYPINYWMADGATGDLMRSRSMSRFFPGVVAYYGRPAVADLVPGGEPELLFDSSYVLGVMTPEPKAVWSHPTSTYQRDGIGDVNGDGRLEVGGAGYGGRFRCFDGATGEIRWEVPLAGSFTSTVTADIDGDGRDEFLVGVDRRVVAVGETAEGDGAIHWKCELPATPTTPTIADTDGDGLAELIVMGDDGVVYCLDRPRQDTID